jgi:hypothetical protein
MNATVGKEMPDMKKTTILLAAAYAATIAVGCPM